MAPAGSRGPLAGTSNAGPKKRLNRPGSKPKTPTKALTPVPYALQPAPPAPDGLGRSGLAVWSQIAGAAWLSASDHRTLESYARSLDQADALTEILDRDGLILSKVLTDRRGVPIGEEQYAHPALSALRSVERRLEAARRELALSPAARIRLGVDVMTAAQMEAEAVANVRKGLANVKRRDI